MSITVCTIKHIKCANGYNEKVKVKSPNLEILNYNLNDFHNLVIFKIDIIPWSYHIR